MTTPSCRPVFKRCAYSERGQECRHGQPRCPYQYYPILKWCTNIPGDVFVSIEKKPSNGLLGGASTFLLGLQLYRFGMTGPWHPPTPAPADRFTKVRRTTPRKFGCFLGFLGSSSERVLHFFSIFQNHQQHDREPQPLGACESRLR